MVVGVDIYQYIQSQISDKRTPTATLPCQHLYGLKISCQNGAETSNFYLPAVLGRGSDRASQDSQLRSQRGGVEFINFPSGSFRSELCCGPPLLESGLRSKRPTKPIARGRPRTQESRNLISDPNSWPRMTPICIFKNKTPNIVHKCPI